MEIITSYATKNPCYKKATPMKPVGIVVHSTGANNPWLKRYVDCENALGKNQHNNTWNDSNMNVCVHAFIGYDKDKNVKVAETLPYNYACWGVGAGTKGSYNYNPTGHIQFEICEDDLNNKEYFYSAFNMAIQYCAYLCKKFNLSPDSIVSHKEAHSLGYGSSHVDPNHWMAKYNMTMEDFRNRVKKTILNVDTEKDEFGMIYKTYNDIPDWGKPTIKKLMDKGFLQGDGKGNLDLPLEILRVYVVNDRAGLYGK